MLIPVIFVVALGYIVWSEGKETIKEINDLKSRLDKLEKEKHE